MEKENVLPFALILAGLGALAYYFRGSLGFGTCNSCQDCCSFCTGSIDVPGTITNDPSTWPSGDNIWKLAQAIAMAEGANVAGSNPDRLNNPGDISDGYNTYGGESHSGSNITNFPDKVTGWQHLYNKLKNIANGNSAVYSVDWTWTQFAQKWAGDWQDWVNNVTAAINVSPDDRVGDYFGA